MSVARAAGMAKGRNRKNVAREPNGRPQREAARPHRQRVVQWAAIMNEPRLGSQLGLLSLAGKVTQQEYEAGLAYRDARDAYTLAMGFPPPSARGQNIAAIHGLAIQPDDDTQRDLRERAERRLTAMEAVIGSDALAAVQWVCAEDRAHEGHAQYLALVDGLRRLAAWRKGGRS